MDAVQLARLRQTAYGLLGAMLLYPQEETIAGVAEAASHLRNAAPWTAGFAFDRPLHDFLRCAERLTPGQVPELQNRYFALFGVNAPVQPVPLCESAYLDPVTLASGQLMADIEQEYTSVGLSISSPGGEMPDHAAVELEFVSFLCGREGEAFEAGNVVEALDAINREKRFLEQHPCQWFPSLVRAVATRDAPDLYARTVQAAHALVVHDADIAGAWAAHLSGYVREEQH